MEKIEYRTMDKSKWGHGPWHQEPDKVQWKDEATGLPCLVVRNHGGAWCGYAGVSEGHPLFGIGYSSHAKLPKATLAAMLEAREVADIYADDLEKDEVNVEAILSAHGGITFADFCSSHTEDDFKKWQKRMAESRAEAAKYPIGDAANRLREWAHEMNDFGAWKEKCQAEGICHVPGAGEPDRVWWFGFDCSHSGDVSPGYESRSFRSGSYKSIEYAKRNVAELAKQLKAVG